MENWGIYAGAGELIGSRLDGLGLQVSEATPMMNQRHRRQREVSGDRRNKLVNRSKEK